MKPLELAGQRQIAIKDERGKPHRFTLAQVTRERWVKYYKSIVHTNERKGDKVFPVDDFRTAMTGLAMDVLLSADGYKLPAGVEKITELPDWKAKIPAGHRFALGQMLTRVSVIAPTDEEDDFGFQTIGLEATWNCDADGNMLLHTPLLHHFGTPSFEHEHRYRRDSARMAVVGGGRTGKTIYYPAEETLMEIYDELIMSVEGYTINGQPVQDPAQDMDASHKFVAAQELFREPPPVKAEAKPEEAAEAA